MVWWPVTSLKFKFVTDHHTLFHTSKKNYMQGRLDRWLDFLADNEFKTVYRREPTTRLRISCRGTRRVASARPTRTRETSYTYQTSLILRPNGKESKIIYRHSVNCSMAPSLRTMQSTYDERHVACKRSSPSGRDILSVGALNHSPWSSPLHISPEFLPLPRIDGTLGREHDQVVYPK